MKFYAKGKSFIPPSAPFSLLILFLVRVLFLQSQHPDGHRAPIRDLVGRPLFGPPTPPHNLGLTSHTSISSTYPSSPSPSPYSPHPSSPSQTSQSSSTSFNETSDAQTGIELLYLSFSFSLSSFSLYSKSTPTRSLIIHSLFPRVVQRT